MSKTVGILGFDEVEALDFVGPYEVFTTAERVSLREGLGSNFRVISIAKNDSFTARAGLTINSQFLLEDAPALDVLIVPGGVTTAVEADPEIIGWLSKQGSQTEIVASVCTGSFLLAKANLIGEKSVTTHWEDIADLRAKFPLVSVIEGVRWVDSGKLVTSAGISAGMDMSLHLVERLGGLGLAILTARQMDYNWVRQSGL